MMVMKQASNASELIASISFASHKKKKNVSMAYADVCVVFINSVSALYGAATMNCTFCLSIFMVMIFIRGFAWTFSAETSKYCIHFTSHYSCHCLDHIHCGGHDVKEDHPSMVVYPVNM